jgi:hypothetical protein
VLAESCGARGELPAGHPGLDPGSTFRARPGRWMPNQVRHDKGVEPKRSFRGCWKGLRIPVRKLRAAPRAIGDHNH